MKKIIYYVIPALLMFAVSSCDEVNYKDMNITQHEEDINIKELVGDLTSQIVVKNIAGESVTEVNMGETFYLIDNTAGGANTRSWTITKGSATVHSDDQLVRVNFAKPGTVTVSLTSERTSDGETVTSETTVTVNSIPVAASFITNPAEANGKVSILQGASVSFTTQLAGSPETFAWEFSGPATLTSTEQNPTIRFTVPGDYKVTFTATRDDGEEGLSQAVVEKTAYIHVEPLVLYLVRAKATDSKIELQYNYPIAQSIPANLFGEFSVKIKTAAGATLTPAVTAAAVTGTNKLELTFGDKMYSDDVVMLSFASSGIFKDETGLATIGSFTDEVCTYGHNLLTDTDMEDPSKFIKSSYSSSNATYAFVDENSAKMPAKPYQGKTCMAIPQGAGGALGVSIRQPLNTVKDEVIVIAYEAMRPGTLGGALERRLSTSPDTGGNEAGGNWSNINTNGGVNIWTTVTKEIVIGAAGGSGGTNGKVGTFYMAFFRYNGAETDVFWVDNLRIYHKNPRP